MARDGMLVGEATLFFTTSWQYVIEEVGVLVWDACCVEGGYCIFIVPFCGPVSQSTSY